MLLCCRGDYRTGKRLNMRKVIPYIASQFRKDKIWLRRTKPSKRQYQIMLAIDDSSSMVDNHSKQVRPHNRNLLTSLLSVDIIIMINIHSLQILLCFNFCTVSILRNVFYTCVDIHDYVVCFSWPMNP